MYFLIRLISTWRASKSLKYFNNLFISLCLLSINKLKMISIRHPFAKLMSYCEVDSRGRLRDKLWDPFQVFLPERFLTPSSWSIICSSSVWSSALSGATEMSRTARNSPQLFRCSFSRRKKFHTKRLRGDGEEGQGGFFSWPSLNICSCPGMNCVRMCETKFFRLTWRPQEERGRWLRCSPLSHPGSLWSEKSGRSRRSEGSRPPRWHSSSRPRQSGGTVTVCGCVCLPCLSSTSDFTLCG